MEYLTYRDNSIHTICIPKKIDSLNNNLCKNSSDWSI